MWNVIGQNLALNYLKKSFASNRLSHAYLFVGPAQIGKMTLALNLAQAVNCTSENQNKPCGSCSQCNRTLAGKHTDVDIIKAYEPSRNGTTRHRIGIDQIRELQHKLNLKPFEGAFRVTIFDDAERMTEEASNALLKTLEEPPSQSLLILLSSQETQLLPTIKSRCIKLKFNPLPVKEIIDHILANYSTKEDTAHLIGRLSKGCLGWAIEASINPRILEERVIQVNSILNLMDSGLEDRFRESDNLVTALYNNRKEALQILKEWLGVWRDIMLIKNASVNLITNTDYTDILKSKSMKYSSEQILNTINRIQNSIESLDNNANPRLAIETIMIMMPRNSN
ncbi:DNA polymerase III subunit delta' [SAR202 cluster bacterium AC-409-J13_OGT_754m]|nr:DNA polymerase III subunit delta' [SAR202 cluster bacterium AC-409-J13_OGT_754m]